jgi:HSP20 family molecular chaperone IbpA
MPESPPPEERERLDKEAKEKQEAEQATLPYKWTQTIKDVDITIAIPANIKGRDLDVTLTKAKLRVAIKGQAPFIDVYNQSYKLYTPQH